ncbi:MAG: hypothetical protein OEW81_12405, partial [Gammaproteobacteria bacterium]|nr:hypothetical protein [Gammaproteobacteria bacterium]
RYFTGAWEPDDIPDLATCQGIQADTRFWLLCPQVDDQDFYDAIRGLVWESGNPKHGRAGKFTRLDSGIALKGWPSRAKVPVGDGYEERLVWKWRVENAPLRSVCALAVATIYESGLQPKITECQREGCGNIFLDTVSRGKKRKYCHSPECEAILNRDGKRRHDQKKKIAKKKCKRAKK